MLTKLGIKVSVKLINNFCCLSCDFAKNIVKLTSITYT